MPKVLFFSGQRVQVGNIFCEKAPEGFDASWRPHDLNDNEKKDLIKNVEFLVLLPGAIAGSVLKEAGSLRLIQLLSAGYAKIDKITKGGENERTPEMFSVYANTMKSSLVGAYEQHRAFYQQNATARGQHYFPQQLRQGRPRCC